MLKQSSENGHVWGSFLHLNIVRCLNPPQTIQHFVHPLLLQERPCKREVVCLKVIFHEGGEKSQPNICDQLLCARTGCSDWLLQRAAKNGEKTKIMCDRQCPLPTDSLLVASNSSYRSQAGEWAFGMVSHDHGANMPCWSCGGWPQILLPSLTMWEKEICPCWSRCVHPSVLTCEHVHGS